MAFRFTYSPYTLGSSIVVSAYRQRSFYVTQPILTYNSTYFRAGVLHWGQQSPSTNGSLSHSVALRSVLGVRRYWDSSKRPHCFEIALADGSRLLLAASDDHAASAWLQSLLLHAAQVNNCIYKSATRLSSKSSKSR